MRYDMKNITIGGLAIIAIIAIMFAITNNGDSVQNGNVEDRRGDSEALGLKMPDGSSDDGADGVQLTITECPNDVEVEASTEEVNVAPGCVVKGDVKVAIGTTHASAHKSDEMGNLLHCPSGCIIIAEHGANISDRAFDSLLTEQFEIGCNGGCAKVHEWTFDGTTLSFVKTHVKGDPDAGKPTAQPSPSPSATATSTPEPTSTQPIDDGCEPELKLGEKRVIAKGCIVVGDVFVRPAGSDGEFRPVFDNRKDTGTVHLLTEDTEVWNLQGASIMPAGMELADIVTATKLAGCGTGYGCPEGIYDWDGNRLDVVN